MITPRTRFALRASAVSAAVVLTAPLWAACRLAEISGRRGLFFASCSELLSLVPGLAGILLRRGFYRMTTEYYSIDSSIGFGTTLAHPDVRIERGVYIGNRCTIGRAVIEEDCTIGSNVDLLSGRHQHNFDGPDTPVQQRGGRYVRVRIGRNTWVGNSTVIMADVGAGCVLGAGSVVVKPVPPHAVAVGNPAVVKRLLRPEEAAEKTGCVRPAQAGFGV